jgi:hypothetical protein
MVNEKEGNENDSDGFETAKSRPVKTGRIHQSKTSIIHRGTDPFPAN